MQLNISHLQTVSDKLFTYLKASGVESVDLPVDYYWEIPSEQRYDPYSEPNEFTLGQLSEDLSELYDLLEGKKSPIAYYFVWLGTVLKALGERVIS